ncbi:hypothetical protein MMC25_005151 [Agyrium rufum]|nr:hypothetical protein [Agyrium rufum]
MVSQKITDLQNSWAAITSQEEDMAYIIPAVRYEDTKPAPMKKDQALNNPKVIKPVRFGIFPNTSNRFIPIRYRCTDRNRNALSRNFRCLMERLERGMPMPWDKKSHPYNRLSCWNRGQNPHACTDPAETRPFVPSTPILEPQIIIQDPMESESEVVVVVGELSRDPFAPGGYGEDLTQGIDELRLADYVPLGSNDDDDEEQEEENENMILSEPQDPVSWYRPLPYWASRPKRSYHVRRMSQVLGYQRPEIKEKEEVIIDISDSESDSEDECEDRVGANTFEAKGKGKASVQDTLESPFSDSVDAETDIDIDMDVGLGI